MDQTQPPPYPGEYDPNTGRPYQRPHMPPPPPPPPSSSGLGVNIFQSCLVAACVTVFVPVLIVFGFFFFLFLVVSSSVDSDKGSSGGASFGEVFQTAGRTNLRTRILRPGDSDNTIAVVSIHGVIGGGGSPLDGEGMLAYVSEQLKSAAEDDSVKAVILQIDSPGGGLTASDQLYHEVQRLRKKGKPVLAWAGSVMASGGYYIAAAADEIMANPTSTVGSIGVIMQHYQVSDLLGKIGVRVDPITSGEHKDIGSPYREMTPEERALLQEYINVAHQRFVDIVATGRNMPEDKVREVATGGIFDAESAKRLGLVDSVGYIEDAVAWAEKKAGRSGMRIVGYRRLLSFGDIFAEASSSAAAALVGAAKEPDAPRAMAVWEGK